MPRGGRRSVARLRWRSIFPSSCRTTQSRRSDRAVAASTAASLAHMHQRQSGYAPTSIRVCTHVMRGMHGRLFRPGGEQNSRFSANARSWANYGDVRPLWSSYSAPLRHCGGNGAHIGGSFPRSRRSNRCCGPVQGMHRHYAMHAPTWPQVCTYVGAVCTHVALHMHQRESGYARMSGPVCTDVYLDPAMCKTADLRSAQNRTTIPATIHRGS